MNPMYGAEWLDTAAGIVLVVVLWRFCRRSGMVGSQGLFALASLLFLIGMSPWMDQYARHSLWLHSWQSVLIHHMAPLLWMAALHPVCARQPFCSAGKSSSLGTRATQSDRLLMVLLLLFTLLTWGWMLPALHPLLMASAALYALMKWLMALSGVSLCFVVFFSRPHNHRWISFTVIVPMLLMGITLMLARDLFSGYHTPLTATLPLPELLSTGFSLPVSVDQRLAGFIFLISALIYWAGEQITGLARLAPPARVAVGVSPNKRRYS
ncbi:MAG: hypothetical protein CMI02_18375 [Oceanospirillaceae bacterium]|nr:hypothetical protein [Oceanospirillaceae bacterium]MBT13992.1 hypothetical protein [Oceanospirillaceae bacterium]|tara:strand:+ start:10490 stop:11290 length:801 start_codon:yes stop_codon:yes gene_type:complete